MAEQKKEPEAVEEAEAVASGETGQEAAAPEVAAPEAGDSGDSAQPASDAAHPSDGKVVHLAEFQKFAAGDGPPAGDRIELIGHVELPITVELGQVSMSIRQLLDTGPGSIIELDRDASEPVDILAGGRLIGHGEVVVIDESLGVRITELVNAIDREVDGEAQSDAEKAA